MKLRYQILTLAFLGLAVYGNSLINGFVFDDHLITENPIFKSRAPLDFFKEGFFYRGDLESGAATIYRPISLFLFRTTYALFGTNPFVFHALPLISHITTATLALLLFRRFLSVSLALVLSAIFMVHPINSEAVAYIAPINDLLFVTFGISALLLTKKPILAATLLLLSLLSKETGILFFPLIYTTLFAPKLKNRLILITPLISLSIYLLLRILVAKVTLFVPGFVPIANATISERLLTVPKVIFYYLKGFFFPHELTFSQHWVVKTADFQNFWAPLIVDLAFASALVWLNVKIRIRGSTPNRGYYLFLLWFLLGLAFHSQLIPLNATAADRWFYFSEIGLLGIIGFAISRLILAGVLARINLVLPWLAVFIILILSARTFIRNLDWKDNLTLASHDIQTNKDSFELELLYGTELLKLKEYEQAKLHFEKSVNLNPYYLNINNLATAHLALGQNERALELFAVSAKKYGYYKSWENLASIYLQSGELNKSKEVLDEALKLYPNNSKLWYILSLYFEKTNQPEEATKAKENYLRLRK